MTVDGRLRKQAESALTGVVAELEARYTGGTEFFDALDERLRNPFWYRALLLRYLDLYSTVKVERVSPEGLSMLLDVGRPILAVSGEFGVGFATWLSSSEWVRYVPPAKTFPGNLRHSELPRLNEDLTGMDFVFVDDSYYKGRTYGQIKRRIEEAGGAVFGAIVLYDGSLDPAKVPSYFRYHK